MRRVLLPFIAFLLTCAGIVRAQTEAQFSQYYMAMGYYNPAYAGNSEDLNIFSIGRLQSAGIPNTAKSIFVMGDMPFKFLGKNHGVGAVVNVDAAGLYRTTAFGVQYAYKQKLWGGTLSGGIQIGFANLSFQGDSVYLPNEEGEDEAIPKSQVSGMGLDMSAGLYYTHKKFYVGIGVTHAMSPEIKLDEFADSYIERMVNFTAGYNIKTRNPLYELQPSVFFQTNMTNHIAIVTARLIYNKRFSGGIAWNSSKSVGLILGASLGRFQAGYAYDYPYNALNKGSWGSHELMVKYSFKLQKTKTGKNRHKSVRIL